MRNNNFSEQIRYTGEPEQRPMKRRNPRNYDQRGNIVYLAPKGTAHKANTDKKKKKRSTRATAILLSLMIGIGGATAIAHTMDTKDVPSIIQIQELGINPQNMGLSQETIEALKKYDEYFENFDSKSKYSLTDEKVISMIDEIEGLHFSVVKEKMADLRGVTAKDVKMYYRFEKGDGTYISSVVINEDKYSEKETYSDSPTALPFGIGRTNHLPKSITEVITQLEDLKTLKSELKTDNISKVNAIKQLKKLYENMEKLATGQLIIDEKGNISVIEFAELKEQTQSKEKDEER